VGHIGVAPAAGCKAGCRVSLGWVAECHLFRRLVCRQMGPMSLDLSPMFPDLPLLMANLALHPAADFPGRR
jgi:hypothetical protein